MMYHLLKPLLFKMDAEQSHHFTLEALNVLQKLKLLHYPRIENPRKVMGMTFPNPIGLAAGLDKNGDYIEALTALGFGFIEIGTVTPKPQPGNDKPRLFRLVKEEAIINRLGFNNKGMDYVASRLANSHYRGMLGINIGKNRDTPNEKAIDDYVSCFRQLAPFANYITINISSPNTQGLRDLQYGEAFTALLQTMKNEQNHYLQEKKKYVPLVLKISPDLSNEEIKRVAEECATYKMDGMIATNTTTTRTGVEASEFVTESGGLSGKPLQARSTQVVKLLHEVLQTEMPIIAAGGIMDAESARSKYEAGASLLQIYSGLIYHGPQLIQALANPATSAG